MVECNTTGLSNITHSQYVRKYEELTHGLNNINQANDILEEMAIKLANISNNKCPPDLNIEKLEEILGLENMDFDQVYQLAAKITSDFPSEDITIEY